MIIIEYGLMYHDKLVNRHFIDLQNVELIYFCCPGKTSNTIPGRFFFITLVYITSREYIFTVKKNSADDMILNGLLHKVLHRNI